VLRDPEDADDPAVATQRRYYPFRATDYDEVAAHLEATDARAAGPLNATRDDYETPYEGGYVHPVLDVGPRDVGLEVRSNRGLSVLETSLDDDAIVAAFEAYEREPRPFERVGEYEGYTLLSVPESPWTVGVRDGVVVEGFVAVGFPEPVLREPQAVVEAFVDARAGEGRYVERDDALGELVAHLGSGTFVNGAVHPTATHAGGANSTATPPTTGTSDPVATGTAVSVDGEAARARHVAVFASASAASVDALDRDPLADWDDIEMSTDGRVVVVEGTRDAESVL
jgi:hypothetical protein